MIVLLYKRTNLIFVIPFLSGGLAFVAGGIILYLSGVDPVEAYELMLKGSFGTKRAIAETLVKTISLLTAGLAVAVAFKCKCSGTSALRDNCIWVHWVAF